MDLRKQKRNEEDTWRDFLREQTSTRSPLKVKDGNVGSFLVGRGKNQMDHHFPKRFKTSPKPQRQKLPTVHQGENKENEASNQPGGASAVLQERGKSVCLINGMRVRQGEEETVIYGMGIMWIDAYGLILTNYHVVCDCLDGYQIKEGFIIKILFNSGSDHLTFTAERVLDYFDPYLDVAVIQIKLNQQSRAKNLKLPAGLLAFVAPMPNRNLNPKSEIYIIALNAGGVKQYDKIRIVDPENRMQVVTDHLARYKDSNLTLLSVKQTIENQGILNVMMGGDLVTYLGSAQEGTSGAPLIDAYGFLLLLHTGGYNYGFPNNKILVMACGRDLITIAKKYVSKQRERGNVQVLERVEEMAVNNPHLKQILEPEPMEVD